jgi:hypothetical protein
MLTFDPGNAVGSLHSTFVDSVKRRQIVSQRELAGYQISGGKSSCLQWPGGVSSNDQPAKCLRL